MHKLAKRTDIPNEEAVYVHEAKSTSTVSAELKIAESKKAAKEVRVARAKQPFPYKAEYQGDCCGECGIAHASRRTWTMDARIGSTYGLKDLFCDNCGYRALPFLPSGDTCTCPAPPLERHLVH